jgi:hypothetical protein
MAEDLSKRFVTSSAQPELVTNSLGSRTASASRSNSASRIVNGLARIVAAGAFAYVAYVVTMFFAASGQYQVPINDEAAFADGQARSVRPEVHRLRSFHGEVDTVTGPQ